MTTYSEVAAGRCDDFEDNEAACHARHRAAAHDKPAPDPAQCLTRLIRTLEGEIIPRLVLVHRQPVAAVPAKRAARSHPDASDVLECVRLVLQHDAGVALAYAHTLHAQGVPIAAIYLDLLAPVARQLGTMWMDDEVSFAEVTVGLCRLHQTLRELAPEFRGRDFLRGGGRRALLLPAPGEQHMFGVVMVAEFFRRAGWEVSSGPAESAAGLVRLVKAEWFAIAGLSISHSDGIDALRGHITNMRRESRNPDIAVLVGGQALTDDPDLAVQVGADGTGSDASTAILRAENLLATRG